MCRLVFCLFWIVALAVTGAVPGAEGKKAAGDDKLTLRTYDVRALLPAASEKGALRDVCTSTIAPKTWDLSGGEARLDIVGTKLIVMQSEAAHANIAALLAALKKLPRAPAKPIAAARLGPLTVGTQQVGKETMQIVVYPVTDLVLPPGVFRGDFGALVDQVRKTVAPKSWEENGGPGVIRGHTLLALVVSNTAEVQTQITGLLAKLRRGGKAGRRTVRPGCETNPTPSAR